MGSSGHRLEGKGATNACSCMLLRLMCSSRSRRPPLTARHALYGEHNEHARSNFPFTRLSRQRCLKPWFRCHCTPRGLEIKLFLINATITLSHACAGFAERHDLDTSPVDDVVMGFVKPVGRTVHHASRRPRRSPLAVISRFGRAADPLLRLGPKRGTWLAINALGVNHGGRRGVPRSMSRFRWAPTAAPGPAT